MKKKYEIVITTFGHMLNFGFAIIFHPIKIEGYNLDENVQLYKLYDFDVDLIPKIYFKCIKI